MSALGVVEEEERRGKGWGGRGGEEGDREEGEREEGEREEGEGRGKRER